MTLTPDKLSVEILIECNGWAAQPAAKDAIDRAVMEAAEVTKTNHGEVAIVLTDDAAIRDLNRTWRGIDAPTNVLSFPAKQGPGAPARLGDIVIPYETVAREAIAQEKPFAHHLMHLAVHGFLHLLGHDHETDGDADVMEGLERAILARLHVPDPYATRDAT